MARIFKLILFSVLFVACSKGKQQTAITTAPDSSLHVVYAKGFRIDYFPHYKQVSVVNPWKKNEVFACYYLVSNKATTTPPDGQKILTPLHTIAATSCTHFEFLQLIGECNSIKGVCSPQLIYNATLQRKYQQGQITDLGDAFSLNIEKAEVLHPDAVLLSGFNQEDPAGKRLRENGIPVIYDNEWTENNLLARAEWIKFVAAFYDKEALADSIFKEITNRYTSVKQLAQKATHKPSILCGGNFKGTWYLPGGKNYMAQLFADAGGSYFYAKDPSTESLPLNVETVLNNFHTAEIWLGCPASSYKELNQADERIALFAAVKRQQVYNFNKRLTASGANDFWESGTAHPDWILQDVIKILHPELLPDYEFTYAKQLTINN